jgi:serine/threonine protein kinase
MTNIQEIAEKGELFDGHYKLLRPLSTDGATADVWLAMDTITIDTEYDEEGTAINGNADETGMLVAIKIYRPKNALDIEGEQRFRDEYKIVYECRHENLLQPTSFAIYQDVPYLVLPYCKNGSSEQLIGKKLTTEEIWKFISDVASGLAKLHSNQPQIIHQDIKPANILIDNNHNYAITDFGISSKTNGSHGSYYDTEHSGTFAYMSPERFEDNPTPTTESDIWAFGATLCEILTGKVPFGEEGGKVQDAHTPMPSLSGFPSSIKNLIHACLQKNPKKRPTAKQIKQAAQSKQYPLKRKKPLIITISLLTCILIAGAVYYFFIPPQEPELPVAKSTEELYEIALRQMNIDNVDSLLSGLKDMDSLSKFMKYVPAMYQIVFTNGWYSDPISVQRKKLLNIEVDINNFPKDEGKIVKTRALMMDILELNDSSNAYINADVAYRLASYYGDERLNKQLDYSQAKKYLDISENWAKSIQDTSMVNKIQKTRNKIEEKLEADLTEQLINQ